MLIFTPKDQLFACSTCAVAKRSRLYGHFWTNAHTFLLSFRLIMYSSTAVVYQCNSSVRWMHSNDREPLEMTSCLPKPLTNHSENKVPHIWPYSICCVVYVLQCSTLWLQQFGIINKQLCKFRKLAIWFFFFCPDDVLLLLALLLLKRVRS